MSVAVPAPIAFFNCAFVKPGVDPRTLVDDVRTHYEARRLPFSLRFRSPTPRLDAESLRAIGLADAGTSPLMVVDAGAIAAPAGFEIRTVDAPSWEPHVRTVADGFGMPRDLLRELFTPALLDSGVYAGFVLVLDGEVVSTAALIVTDDVAGVYNVATPASWRGRGFGEAVTRAAVAEGARRGCRLATLQASEMGLPIYERMGFRTVTHWDTATSP